MKRALVGTVASALLVGALLLAGPAHASSGQSSTSVTLACDRGASAHVELDLSSQQGVVQAQLPDLNCDAGTKRVRVSVPSLDAITSGDVVTFTGTFSEDCGGPISVPVKVSCPLDGSRPGATLTVR